MFLLIFVSVSYLGSIVELKIDALVSQTGEGTENVTKIPENGSFKELIFALFWPNFPRCRQNTNSFLSDLQLFCRSPAKICIIFLCFCGNIVKNLSFLSMTNRQKCKSIVHASSTLSLIFSHSAINGIKF